MKCKKVKLIKLLILINILNFNCLIFCSESSEKTSSDSKTSAENDPAYQKYLKDFERNVSFFRYLHVNALPSDINQLITEYVFLPRLRSEPISYSEWRNNGEKLFVASYEGSVELVKLLLGSGEVDVDTMMVPPDEGYEKPITCLAVACFQGYEDIAKLLLEFGANINLSMPNWFNPLSAAVISGNENIVKLLLERKANVNATGCRKISALGFAVHGRIINIVKLLLQYGADIDMKYEGNHTVFGYCRRFINEPGVKEIYDCLKSAKKQRDRGNKECIIQ